ncbi:hypothetical protein RFI_18983 [Reticulomyxa filosa]|uniref:NADH dehydrogenase [ubiquinone] 1 alpha subcomplex subunit 12 n=1 Tax=Reticulomyxa filosa TaxID=46433 RepID=X6MZ08_RETFI|nr:hypothetical protein RFI_18983 [Reticulomyxa filosa]|eukprot:ETO18295.1 hypothetical protein RFI_18983 [Reticulomyxa filosa]
MNNGNDGTGPQNNNDKRHILLNLRALKNRIKAVGVWQTILDFNQSSEINFGETLGTLRGVDEFGNRYYENLDNQFGLFFFYFLKFVIFNPFFFSQHKTGRHRWINYAERRRELSHAGTIPPGWWGWIHFSNSHIPADEGALKPPRWVLLHQENFTGSDKRYVPSNYGRHRANLKYEPWQPNRPKQITAQEYRALNASSDNK